MLTEAAPAKVNLFLHVLGKRADGYHELDSLAVFPGIGDELRASPAGEISLRVEGPFAAALGDSADNLALRAARLLADAAGVRSGVSLVLHKALPVASGIGGGSADAAAALRTVARLWNLPDTVSLSSLAARLGADVPVCLACRPARMGGIGESLAAAPSLPPAGIVLVNPGVAVSTADVFRARQGPFSPAARLPEGWATPIDMARDLAALGNDLEAPAVSLCPEIGALLAELRVTPGCLLARMSGSGATCFALFNDAPAAARAREAIGRPDRWIWSGPLQPGSGEAWNSPAFGVECRGS